MHVTTPIRLTAHHAAVESTPRVRAFTLVELLVVMGIMVMILAIAVPSMSSLFNSGRVDGAIDTITVAAASARSYAVSVPRFFDADPITVPEEGSYSGAAALFTPANEIRLIHNVATARDGNGWPLEIKDPNSPFGYKPQRNGYQDIHGRDPISLPSDVGFMGIVRIANAIKYIPPPFAVSFNQNGNLVTFSDPVTVPAARDFVRFLVYYDGDYSGDYNVDLDREDGTYLPDEWDPQSDQYTPGTASDRPGIDEDFDMHRLPFEAIETVVGVYVYDKTQLWEAVDADDRKLPSYDTNDPLGQWLEDNAVLLMFNRYTGRAVQEVE